MSDRIESGAIKVIEVIGVSQKSFDDAVHQAVKKASDSVKGITGVEVIRHSAKVSEGGITRFHANCKLAFVVK